MASVKEHATSETNLFIGNLTPEVTTESLRDMFEPFGTIDSCKVMMDINTHISRGFGFVKYRTKEQASYAIESMNNSTSREGVKMMVKFANAGDEEPIFPNNNIFVKGMPLTVELDTVKALFAPYGQIMEARMLNDSATGTSRGHALVRYADVESAARAIEAVHNYKFPGTVRGIIVKYADSEQSKQEKKARVQRKIAQTTGRYNPYGAPPAAYPPTTYPPSTAYPPTAYSAAAYPPSPYGAPPTYPPAPYPQYSPYYADPASPSAAYYGAPPTALLPTPSAVPAAVPAPSAGNDPNNLYVYHLPPEADDALLYKLFTPFGAIHSVKIGREPGGQCKGFGFVRMVNHPDAWAAVNGVNGQKVGSRTLTVTFKNQRGAPPPVSMA